MLVCRTISEILASKLA